MMVATGGAGSVLWMMMVVRGRERVVACCQC